MKPDKLLQEFEGAARELAIKVTYEPLVSTVGHGGLCRVKGDYRVIIDRRASSYERAITLAAALARLDTSGVQLGAKARAVIDYYRARLAPASAPDRSPGARNRTDML